MSIFERIRNAIIGKQQNDEASLRTPGSPPVVMQSVSDQIAASPPFITDPATGAPPPPTGPMVDIEPILDEAVRMSGQTLDWRRSIVDLMKAIGMDASYPERTELAAELGYTADTQDSAKMNLFLHRALMKALSQNGGRVPPELLK
ncbi:DUF3597 domain-containing protein [Rhizobium sp. YTU87027]|uniref:DUF3597 domain-containing protein n=1 Tax=Rhizobium sp. YTU87027 TaxID=3417741 RepID=UPI003D696C24